MCGNCVKYRRLAIVLRMPWAIPRNFMRMTNFVTDSDVMYYLGQLSTTEMSLNADKRDEIESNRDSKRKRSRERWKEESKREMKGRDQDRER